MKSDADFWIKDMHGGRWWHTVESKQKGFTDVMKGEKSLPPAMVHIFVEMMSALNG